jgi:hypothetical protein
MCSEKFTLEGEQLTRLEKLIESESQEALEEDEALKVNKEDVEPISDDKEAEESEDFQSNIKLEAPCQAESILAETQPSIHNQPYDVEGDEVVEEEVVKEDGTDLLPPPITQLSGRG